MPEPEDLKLYADALPKLAGAGMRIGVESLHRRLRIPMARDGEEILRGPAAAPGAETAPPAPAPKPAKTAALAGQLAASGEPRDALDDLVDDAVAEWRPALAPMVEPLLAELQKGVEQGETLEAFAARLPQLIERMDGRPLGETLARVAFAANLAGQADLDITGEA